MKALEAIRKRPATIGPEATIAEAARMMDAGAVGALVVVEDGQLVGIVTDRDLVTRALARGVPADGRVDAVMTTSVITLDADAELRDAVALLREHPVRRVPVVRGGHVLGMVTVDDLLVDLVADLGDIVRPVTGQVLFGHPEPAMPVVAG